jgi:hypothetical protein
MLFQVHKACVRESLGLNFFLSSTAAFPTHPGKTAMRPALDSLCKPDNRKTGTHKLRMTERKTARWTYRWTNNQVD